MRNLFKTYWPQVVIIAFGLLLAITNIVPNTYLTGWDNLHTEFDFKTNIIERGVMGVWQEYQGLGILSGNAHSADLPRQIGLLIASIIVPDNLLRYFYHLFAWVVGGIGAYYLIDFILKKSENHSRKIAAFLGAVFYLFNLGTLQNFYAPYEAFSHNFASFPWLLLSLFYYLKSPTWRSLAILILTHLLAIPMFYIPTIFVVYCIVLAVLLGSNLLLTRNKKAIKSTVVALVVVFVVNAFWLLPFGYFLSQGTQFVTTSTINRIFTEEAFLRNQKFGKLSESLLLKGFWFDTTDVTVATKTEAQHDFMMRPWMDHYSSPLVQVTGYLFFGLSLVGIVLAFIRKSRYALPIFILWVIGLSAMINANPPTGTIFTLFQDKVPFFRQIFRFPFTKFIVLMSLVYAVFLAFFFDFVLSHLKKLKRLQVVTAGVLVVMTSVLFMPAFDGNFFYKFLRYEVPREYFEVFKFFQRERQIGNNGRIANLPQPTYWGWSQYDWGYRGSGFPWYGIPQPVMDRAFDVWANENENYYRELSYALYDSPDPQQVERIFSKYAIEYVWIDHHIVSPHKPELSVTENLENNLAENFKLVFEEKGQRIYKRKNSLTDKKVLAVPFKGTSLFGSLDTYFNSEQYYFENQKTSATGPFFDLDGYNPEWKVEGKNIVAYINLAGEIVVNNSKLIGAEAVIDEKSITFIPNNERIYVNGNEIRQNFNEIQFTGEQINPSSVFFLDNNNDPIQNNQQVLLNQQSNHLSVYNPNDSKKLDISQFLFKTQTHNCDLESTGEVSKALTTVGVILNGSFAKPCVYTNLPLSVNNGILYSVEFEYKQSRKVPIELCVAEEGQKNCFYRGVDTTANNPQEWRKVSYIVNKRGIPLDKIWITLALDANAYRDASVDLRNVIVTYFEEPKYQTDFVLENVNSTANLKLVGDNYTFVYPLDKAQTIRPADLNHKKNNCYIFGSQEFDRNVFYDNYEGSYVRYSARDASSCETILVENVPSVGALLSVTLRNNSGRAPKFCLRHDPPGNCIVEDIPVLEEPGWHTVNYVIPPIKNSVQSLYLEIDNYAVGSETRVNDISKISITKLPFEFLKGISIRDVEQSTSLYIEYATGRLSTWWYSQNTRNKDIQLLLLPQTYDPGWIALTGIRVLSHNKINGWANAWEVSTGEHAITIIYLPQLLQFVGFGLLIGTLGYLGVKLFDRRHKLS